MKILHHRESGNPETDAAMPKLVKNMNTIRYKFASRFALKNQVLDLGCGFGYGSYLLSASAKTVTGIDANPLAIAQAKLRYRHIGLEFVTSDALDFLRRTHRRFDLITAFEILEHLKRQREFVNLVADRIRVGGVFVVSTPNRKFTNFYRKNPFHVHEFEYDELKELLVDDGKFTLEHSYGQVPGTLIRVPIPFYALFGIIQLMPGSNGFVELNEQPDKSRTILVLARRTSSRDERIANGKSIRLDTITTPQIR